MLSLKTVETMELDAATSLFLEQTLTALCDNHTVELTPDELILMVRYLAKLSRIPNVYQFVVDVSKGKRCCSLILKQEVANEPVHRALPNNLK